MLRVGCPEARSGNMLNILRIWLEFFDLDIKPSVCLVGTHILFEHKHININIEMDLGLLESTITLEHVEHNLCFGLSSYWKNEFTAVAVYLRLDAQILHAHFRLTHPTLENWAN